MTDVSLSKPSEIAKRTAIFTAVGQLGSMFAGIMMTAMHKTMEGRNGLKGWQWVFLISKPMHQLLRDSYANRCRIDGLMGIPVAVLGYVSHPSHSMQSFVLITGSSHSRIFPNQRPRSISIQRRSSWLSIDYRPREPMDTTSRSRA
jgi:ACS family pantothenate transporter-like MFS transporter